MTSPASLVAFLREDQRVRWQKGDAVPVETYLAQYPHLAADPEAVVDLIWSEWLLRQEQGMAPDVAELQRRFKQYEPTLQIRFQATRTGIVSLGGTAPALASPTSELPEVPGYEILSELGRGGMGVVYLARQNSLGRLVALKMILDGALADARVRARFDNEAQAVARLQHPHIVQIHEVGKHQGRPFFSLEYLENGNLQQAVGGEPQPEQAAARLVETLARAVQYTHERGILHRDLKPSNILLTADGTPKITDFGLAKLQHLPTGPTATEALIGTPSYMSPEQAAGNARQIGPAADIYALGVILYELLTGRVPFHGTTLLQTLEQVRSQPAPPPRRFRRRVSADLETICLRCLEKEPANRYSSAGALADDLRCFLQGQPIDARPIARWRKGWRWVRRHPGLVASVLAVAATVSGLVTAWSYLGAAKELSEHRAEENYRKFLDRRNDAFFRGLLTANRGGALLGGDAASHLQMAEQAAREALALAGVSEQGEIPPDFLQTRPRIAADCYTLWLLLATLRGQQQTPGPDGLQPWREALNILDRAPAFGLRTQAFHWRRAQLLQNLGQARQAKAELERARALGPQGALDYFLAGEEKYRLGDWEAAREAFDQALVQQPGHFWAQFFLSVCHLQARHWETARAGLNACLAQQPGFVWAYLFRSFANERLGALAEARVDFERALATNPGEEARYVLLLTRGILHFNQKDITSAAADFKAATSLRPDHYNGYLNLAQVYLAQGKFEEAENQERKAASLRAPAPVLAGYHITRGRRFFGEKRYQEALQACAAARQLAAEQPQIYDVQGESLLALGQYEAAEESLDLYLLKGGEARPEVFRSRAWARMKRAKYAEASEDYTRALERAPDADLYQHRGWAHYFTDAWQLAERDFRKALELDPGSCDAHVGSALACAMRDQYREAAAEAEAALRLRPRTPEMMHNLACAFAQSAARAEAHSSAPERQKLGRDCREQALQCVRRTLRMLPAEERPSFWRSKILPDAALAPLHSEPAFQQLQREYAEDRR